MPRNRWTGEVPEDYDYSYTELDSMPDGWRKAFGEQKPYGLTPEEAAVQFFEYCADPKTQGHAIELLKIWKEEQELLERNGANVK